MFKNDTTEAENPGFMSRSHFLYSGQEFHQLDFPEKSEQIINFSGTIMEFTEK